MARFHQLVDDERLHIEVVLFDAQDPIGADVEDSEISWELDAIDRFSVPSDHPVRGGFDPTDSVFAQPHIAEVVSVRGAEERSRPLEIGPGIGKPPLDNCGIHIVRAGPHGCVILIPEVVINVFWSNVQPHDLS